MSLRGGLGGEFAWREAGGGIVGPDLGTHTPPTPCCVPPSPSLTRAVPCICARAVWCLASS